MGVPWGIREFPVLNEMCNAYMNEGDWDGPLNRPRGRTAPGHAFMRHLEFKPGLKHQEGKNTGIRLVREWSPLFEPVGNDKSAEIWSGLSRWSG